MTDKRIKSFLSSIRDDDARQEARIRMWKEYMKYSGPTRDMAMFLLRAGRWGMLNEYRKEYPHPIEIDEEHPKWAYTQEIPDPILSIRVRQALETLTPTQRERVIRKFWLDENILLRGSWWYHPKNGVRAKLIKELEDVRS